VGIFDSIPTKVVKLSPKEFGDTADFAADIIAMQDGDLLAGRHVMREAYAGFIIGALALTSAEIMGGWSAPSIEEIARLVRTAHGRLTPADDERARERLRSINGVWNLNWLERE
jgi:hypothetical protein